MSLEFMPGMVPNYQTAGNNVMVQYADVTQADGDEIRYFFPTNVTTLPNGSYIGSKAIVEAIDPTVVPENMGVINDKGEEVIPFENKAIKPITDDTLLVELGHPVSPSVLEAIKLSKNKDKNPNAATQLVTTSAAIKDKMNNIMGPEGRYLLNDQFSEGTIVDLNGNNLVNDKLYSYIGISGNQLYFSTNEANSDIVTMPLNQPVVSETTPEVEAPVSAGVEEVQPIASEVQSVVSEATPEVEAPVSAGVEEVQSIASEAQPLVSEATVAEPTVSAGVEEVQSIASEAQPVVSEATVAEPTVSAVDVPVAQSTSPIEVSLEVPSDPIPVIGDHDSVMPPEDLALPSVGEHYTELQEDIITEVPVVNSNEFDTDSNKEEVAETFNPEVLKSQVDTAFDLESSESEEDEFSKMVGSVDVSGSEPVLSFDNKEFGIVPENTELISDKKPESIDEKNEYQNSEDFDDNNDKIKRIADTLVMLKNRDAKKDAEIEDLKHKLNEANNQIRQAQDQIQQARGDVKRVVEAGRELSYKVKDLQRENQGLMKTNSSLEGTIDSLREEKRSLLEANNSLESTVNDLRKEKQDLVDDNSNKDRKIVSLQRGNAKLREVYDMASSILDESEEENKELKLAA